MNVVIRDIGKEDLEDILRVNQRNVPKVGTVTIQELKSIVQMSCFKRLVEDEKGIFGFILCLFPGQRYESPNYQWFSKNCEDFIYIDRIAIDERYQGNGIGSMLYAELLRFGENSSSECLCCEVNIKPPNEDSLGFHKKQEFKKLGELDTESGKKVVALFMKRLHPAPVDFRSD